MKNSKKINSILATIAIAIWIIIGYKIYSATNTNTTVIKKIKNNKTPEKEFNYTIHTYTTDPFLSILSDTAKKIAAPTEVLIVQKAVVNKVVQTLPVYCGLISNKTQQTAILRFEKKYYMLKKGDELNNMIVVSIKDNDISLKTPSGIVKIKRTDVNQH